MKIHFIAIGGSAMHNLALALEHKGYMITGSDDVIFEPSKTRLSAKGLLPEEFGWFPEKISPLLAVFPICLWSAEYSYSLRQVFIVALSCHLIKL